MAGNAVNGGQVAEGELERDSVSVVVSTLEKLSREAALDYALQVGRVVIEHFYEGRADIWRTRGPKLSSFRRLADHPELPMSASMLYRCVAVYELCERLNVLSRWRGLTLSHLRVVLPLNTDEQERLLGAADRERWSVHELTERARERHERHRPRGGRRELSATVRYARKLAKLGDIDSLAVSLESHALPERERSFILATVERSLQQLTELRELLAVAGDDASSANVGDAGVHLDSSGHDPELREDSGPARKSCVVPAGPFVPAVRYSRNQ